MPRKYHINTGRVDPLCNPVGKFSTIEFREQCAGSCKMCVKKRCVYDIFKHTKLHISQMDEPEFLYTCQSCFRCIQECTGEIFSRVVNPDYRLLGDSYWRPDIIHNLWRQAHLGKVPVSGAGYRGPFSGPGFDSIWTDMSEIVRPTRDGIHGREYINTIIELSRRKKRLKFKEDGTLEPNRQKITEIPLPILIDLTGFNAIGESVFLAGAKAAKMLGTMMIIKPKNLTRELEKFAYTLILCLDSSESIKKHAYIIKKGRAVIIDFTDHIEKSIEEIKKLNPDIVKIARLPLNSHAAETASKLAQKDLDSLLFFADHHGRELDADQPRFLKDMIREVHLRLVQDASRQKINLIFAGGIAMADHIPKAIICGADAIVADIAVMIAMECRYCGDCFNKRPCPVKLDTPIDSDWGAGRIVNLIGAWHSQLLEVMGAMGIREVRRLRGEIGRSMWFDDLEKEIFAPIFSKTA